MKTILIVEDNKFMSEFLKKLLIKDFKIKIENSVEQANFFLHGNIYPDLIILDYLLNEVTCLDLLNTIKTNKFYEKIPVLVLSVGQKSDVRIACLKAGAKDVLAKPFNPIELKLRVQNLIN
jgi:DNA-binding response OmpR family regulator|tara:strand:- start:14511 stop:14873 length:363 start_codon:yes stop_codon:yes gene_type:complete